MKLRCFIIALLATVFASSAAASTALQAEISGPIGPAVALHVHKVLEHAAERHAELVILRMDTPGGLDQAMRDIIHDILASPVPVACFVAPSGARAASAGTYILYAAHIAAMAPATNLGAATPVRLGGMPEIPDTPDHAAKPAKKPEAESGDAMQRKMVNDASAYIRGLAELRGRNAGWAEKAVRQAASLTAEQALSQHVIDLIATDTAGLLQQLDGRSISLPQGRATLHTRGMQVEAQEQGWRSRFLAVITDPNVAYILMLLGIYGLFFELANPGFLLPGVIGGICLLLALFAFQVLPINFAALALIVLGILFMIAEAFVPSFGALGLGGVIAFVIGSLMLMNTELPEYALSLELIIGVAISSSLFFFAVVGMALKARHRPVVSGSEEMVGAIGTVQNGFKQRGEVLVHGEVWQAESPLALATGQKVRVTGMNALTLFVEPIQKE